MKEDTYSIPATDDSLPVMGHLTACHKCGRKVLVEMGLIGVRHHIGLSVTCGECLALTEQFRTEHPAIASKVENWLQSGGE